jgi:hypothetical protein
LDSRVKGLILNSGYSDITVQGLFKESSSTQTPLRGIRLEVGITISLMAEEIAVMYKRMSERQGNPRRAGLLKLASEVLEDLAMEAVRGKIAEETLEKLRVIEKFLKVNGLPSDKIGRLVRVARRYVVPPLTYYLPPQVEASNSMLS